MNKVYNFSAGPSILPQEVFREAAEGVLNLNQSGLSILEISHRSKDFMSILEEAKSLVKELLQVPEQYEILFLTGGASAQFYMSAINFLPEGGTATYIDTGVWSAKAIKEASKFGKIVPASSSKDRNYSYLPKEHHIPNDASYLHYTSNNTIYGTQFSTAIRSEVPVICDMSSDIFSRPIDVAKYAMIYAGAQKNLGPAGTTLVIIDPKICGKSGRNLPSMLDYQVHIENGSMFNTPPTFPIYVSMLNLRWLKKQGGVRAIQQKNIEKANLLYQEIDSNPLFKNEIAREERSMMNVVFDAISPEIEHAFLKFAEENYCSGIKGHRSRGGFRASIYNAMDIEGVQHLVDTMALFSINFNKTNH